LKTYYQKRYDKMILRQPCILIYQEAYARAY